jgi:hypothetical protein
MSRQASLSTGSRGHRILCAVLAEEAQVGASVGGTREDLLAQEGAPSAGQFPSTPPPPRARAGAVDRGGGGGGGRGGSRALARARRAMLRLAAHNSARLRQPQRRESDREGILKPHTQFAPAPNNVISGSDESGWASHYR